MPLTIYDLTTRYPDTASQIAGLGDRLFGGYQQGRKLSQDWERQRLLDEAVQSSPSGTPSLAQLATVAARTGELPSAVQALGLAGQDELRLLQTRQIEQNLALQQQKDAREREALQGWNSLLGGGTSQPQGGGASNSGSFPPSLIRTESGGNWQAQNNAMGAGGKAGHFGRLQFGQARLQEAAAAGAIPEGTTPSQFMASPELQQRAEQWHFSDIDQKIRANGLDRAIGQSINGVPVTLDGMRAVAHLGGSEGLRRFITSGGRYNPADANGTSLLDYLKTHGGQAGGQPQAIPAVASSSDAPFVRPDMDPAKLRSDAQSLAPTNPEAARQMVRQADEIERARCGSAPPVQMAQAQSVRANDAGPQRESSGPLGRMTDADLAQSASNKYLPKEIRDLAREELQARRTMDAERRRDEAQAQRPSERAKQAREAGLVPGSKEFNEFMRGENKQKSLEENIAERTRIADQQGYQGEDRKIFIANGKLPTAQEKMTEGQANAGLYADRMKEAEAVISDPAVTKAMMSPAQKAAEMTPFGFGNYMMSNEGQKGDQAQRNFINATLRRESGAVISPQEFDNARRQYFPQPGDGPDVLRQKAQNRKTAIEGISRAGGPVYAKDQQSRAAPGQSMKTSTGVTWSAAE